MNQLDSFYREIDVRDVILNRYTTRQNVSKFECTLWATNVLTRTNGDKTNETYLNEIWHQVD